MEIYWLLLVGTRKTCVILDLHDVTIPYHPSFLQRGQEKVLFGSPFGSFRPCENDILISVPRLYKMSWPCAMQGGPQ
jgi:hypothetical protein